MLGTIKLVSLPSKIQRKCSTLKKFDKGLLFLCDDEHGKAEVWMLSFLGLNKISIAS
jgi:hypothetical protein